MYVCFHLFLSIIKLAIRPQRLGNDLISCQLTYNKLDGIFDVVTDMVLDALVIIETWLTGNVSNQNIVGDMSPAGYSFNHAVRIHKKGWGSAFLSVTL